MVTFRLKNIVQSTAQSPTDRKNMQATGIASGMQEAGPKSSARTGRGLCCSHRALQLPGSAPQPSFAAGGSCPEARFSPKL